MERARLGTKHECFSCGTKFYDLNKPQALCPRCGTDQSAAPKRVAAPRPVMKTEDVEEAEIVPEEEAEFGEELEADDFPTLDDLEEPDDFDINVNDPSPDASLAY